MANAEQALPRAYDLIVYGASGFTGRLVAEHLLGTYGAKGEVRWAMAGRNTGKLAEVHGLIGGPPNLPLMTADASDPASLKTMAERATVHSGRMYRCAMSANDAIIMAAGRRNPRQ